MKKGKNIKNKGFSFIELAVVVTIVGVAGFIAFPVYQDYVTKSQTANGLKLASSAKPPIIDYYSNMGRFPNKNEDIGLIDNNDLSHINMNIHENGEIRATFGAEVNKVAQGKTLSLYPFTEDDNSIKWECESNLDNRFLPDGCIQQPEPTVNTESKNLTCEPNQKGSIQMDREVTTPSRGAPTYSDWVEVSNTCDYYKLSNGTETQNGNCPDNQRGTLTETRTYELWSDNSKKNFTDWIVSTNTCAFYKVKDEAESRNGTCPTNQRGTLTESRTYELWSDNSKKNFTDWIVATNTCAFYKVKDEAETRNGTCPTNQRGTLTESRTYELWSDNSKKNYGNWTVATNTCAFYKVKDEAETRNGTCPTNQRGTLTERRTYELWSDNSKKNYSNWTVATNTCAFYKVKDEAETRNGTCPTNQRGTLTERRTYELWSDNSKKNYSNWTVATNTCAFYKVKDEYETRNLTCPSGQTGAITERRKYEVWSDNSKKNYGNWERISNTCKAIAGWTATIELMGTVPNTPGCPPNAFLTYYRFVYKWNDGRTTYSSQKRSCGAPNTVPGGPPVYPNYIN